MVRQDQMPTAEGCRLPSRPTTRQSLLRQLLPRQALPSCHRVPAQQMLTWTHRSFLWDLMMISQLVFLPRHSCICGYVLCNVYVRNPASWLVYRVSVSILSVI